MAEWGIGDQLDRTARDVRVVRLPGGPMPLGALAGTDVEHPFVPDGDTGTLCMACFGWCTDFRHWARPALAGVSCG